MATVIHCPPANEPSAPQLPPSPYTRETSGFENQECQLYPMLEGPPGYATLPFNGCRIDTGGVAYGQSSPAHKMDYVDFVPRVLRKRLFSVESEYERFDALIARANYWLDQHPTAEVKSCETMHWTTSTGKVNDICVQRSTADTSNKSSHYTKILSGLRIWYYLPVDEDSHVITQEGAGLNRKCGMVIACRTFLPKRKEDFEKMVDRINRLFENDKFGGEIISSELISRATPNQQASYTPHTLRPNKSVFKERPDRSITRILCLRVYAKMGEGRTLCPSEYEIIGYKDFLPQFNKRRGVAGGYDSFQKVMTNASSWVADQRNVKFTNLQCIRVKRKDYGKFQERMEHREHQCASNRMNPLHGVNRLTPYVTLLRAFFTVQRPTNQRRSKQILPIGLTYRTFSPRQLTKDNCLNLSEFETTRKLMDRVQLWLQISGANVFHAETVRMHFQTPDSSQAEETFSQNGWNSRTINKANSQRWMYHIRLYLDGEYYEPPSAMDLVKNPIF